jgi:dolichyl-phosphate-mannose--protein O-mannosyl transferase
MNNQPTGQQLVTFIKNDPASLNSLWSVRPKHHSEENREYPAEDNADTCTEAAEPVKCGSIIRLTHLSTQTNLHSHGVQSPLSRQQEVTSFGQGDGKGDAGDNWRLECSGKYWKQGAPVRLQHVDTGAYLGGSRQATFNGNNCGHGCPVLNHMEAFGRKSKDELSVLTAETGIFLRK